MTANIEMLRKLSAVTRVCSLASGYVLGAVETLKVTDFVLARLSLKDDSESLTSVLWNTVAIATVCFTAEILVLRECSKHRQRLPAEQPQSYQGLLSIGAVGVVASIFSAYVGQAAGSFPQALCRGVSLFCSIPTQMVANVDVANVRRKGYQASDLYRGVKSLFLKVATHSKVQ